MPGNTPPRVTSTQWAIRAAELLADGEWHDGLEVLREAEKKITPGVAWRKTQNRYVKRRRRETGQEDLDPERRVGLSDAAIIAMGKRTISRSMVEGRLKSGSWESDPTPVPEESWRSGGFRLRSRDARRFTPRSIARDRYGIGPETLRRLIVQEPQVPHSQVGRVTYLYADDLPALDARVQEYKDAEGERRGAARRLVLEQKRQQAPAKSRYSLTELENLVAIGYKSLRKIVDAYPDFPWVRVGKSIYVETTDLAELLELIGKYREGRAERVSAGARLRRSRHGRAPAPTPHFVDEQLSQLYERYRQGNGELRPQVMEEMRRAFHAAPEV